MELNKNKLWQILAICSVLLIFVIIIVFSIKIIRLNKEIKYIKENPVVLYDTIYNKEKLDNIKDDIKDKEKQIDKYKTQIIYETKEAIVLDDSATVKLFYQLLSEL